MQSMESHVPTIDDDVTLLRRYAGDADASAFAELVRRYAGMVYATARRVTGDAAAAEDVAQDCFLRLARVSHVIHGSLPAWLHRTSLNRALEIVRSDRARRRREVEAAATSRPDAAEGPDDSAQIIAHVDEALAALPQTLRIVLTEHFLAGRTQQEIAHRLGVDQSTISRRVERGLDELRRRLRDAGVATIALPAVLAATLRAEAAPPSVHQSLTKIGLAGVRGNAAVGAASNVTRIVAVSGAAAAAALVVVVIAGGMWLRHTSKAAAPAPAAPAAAVTGAEREELELFEHDVLIAWADAPAPVRATLAREAPNVKIEQIEVEREDGEIVYSADVPEGGKLYEITVAADGRLIEKKPADDDAQVKD
jgi:RNA polymerase sigma-70 factor (ECF subfamily)